MYTLLHLWNNINYVVIIVVLCVNSFGHLSSILKYRWHRQIDNDILLIKICYNWHEKVICLIRIKKVNKK